MIQIKEEKSVEFIEEEMMVATTGTGLPAAELDLEDVGST